MTASKRVRLALCSSMAAVIILYCVLLVNLPVVIVDSRNDHKLIVVLLDGFGREQLRHLLDTSDENAFTDMASRGVSAEYLRPIFPTLTLPNHYALMTGLYAENHGVVHDTLYDPRSGELFRFDRKPTLWLANEATPLWLTVQRHGKRVHLSTTQCHKSVPVLNISATCTSTEPNIQLDSLTDNLNQAFRRVALGDDVLAVVHTPLVHEVIHEHGPQSIQTEEVVERLDEILRQFLNDINGLTSKINLMVVSEVGLASTSDKKPVSIDSALNSSLVAKMVGGGAHFGLWPATDKENDAMEALSGLEGIRVQTKTRGRMLEKFHYRNHDLIAPIQIVADYGYVIDLSMNKLTPNSVSDERHGRPKGMHGYDPFHVDDMKAIFYAQGPQFETNSRIKCIHSPEVYDIMRTVLHMDSHHPRKNVAGVMKTHEHQHAHNDVSQLKKGGA